MRYCIGGYYKEILVFLDFLICVYEIKSMTLFLFVLVFIKEC